ncbi:TetR/AcrR family transcriptional regulator [Oceanobacillus sp. CAU 1775]
MKGTTERIMKAAIHVFAKKGFTQATTQEIATEANVAEITLFRKFSTKQNLFTSVIRKIIAHQFEEDLKKWAELADTRVFLSQIIRNRLEMISKNKTLIKMLLSESLMGNLSDDINLPAILYESIKKSLTHHFQRLGKTVDVDLCARQLGGILLSHVIFPSEQLFFQLSLNEKEILVGKYADALMRLLETH